MQVSEPHVTAVLLDENTLSADGVIFERKSSKEAMLAPMSRAKAPMLRCSKCGFGRHYTYWFQKLDYHEMIVHHCPGCGSKIAGVAPWSDVEVKEAPQEIIKVDDSSKPDDELIAKYLGTGSNLIVVNGAKSLAPYVYIQTGDEGARYDISYRWEIES